VPNEVTSWSERSRW